MCFYKPFKSKQAKSTLKLLCPLRIFKLPPKKSKTFKNARYLCKMFSPSATENYRAKNFMDTQEKLIFRGSCYDLSLWRIYTTMPFPTAKPFYTPLVKKEKMSFYL